MSKFIDKFNEETEERFCEFKLSAVNVYVRKKQIELVFLYPESILTVPDTDRAAIEAAAVKALNSDASVSVKLVKSHFDPEHAARGVLEFFKAYPFVSAALTADDITADGSQPGNALRIALEPSVYAYCAERGAAAELEKYFAKNYCDPVVFTLNEKAASTGFLADADLAPKAALTLEKPGGRTILPDNIDALIGKPIYERAVYISDAVIPKESLVVCGTVTRLSDFTFKKKDGSEGLGYRITLEDYTGSMECVYFPSEKTKEKIALLKQGKQVVVRGSLAPGKREGQLSYKLNDISYCTLKKEFTPNRFVRAVDTHYRTVFPKPYEETAQVSLFDRAVSETPPDMRNKTFVVFDLETTGTNPVSDKIVEIGAVKIVDGVFTEVFSTLVDPEVTIPDEVIKIHGITNADVAGKPKIAEALPDFYKFCDQAAIAAQNLPFDYGFVSAAGKPMGIYFDHEQFDTLPLARRFFPGLRHYNLGALCEELGIELKDAHRAVHDAAATAKLLVKIFEAKQKREADYI